MHSNYDKKSKLTEADYLLEYSYITRTNVEICKDYSPKVFYKLRQLYKVKEEDYMVNPLIEMLNF